MNKLVINCDGGSRGNPGPAASAFVVSEDGKEIFKDSRFLGKATNNIAEYNAVLIALEWLAENKTNQSVESVNFILDSELVARQIKGIYKIKNLKLKELHAKIVGLIKKIGIKISFENVAREKNKKADEMVNKELDLHST